MGRRPKNQPKGAPLLSLDITEKQFLLLAWVYDSGYKGLRESRIRWSPTAYRQGELTPSEAVTLSKRKKTLAERGFLDTDGLDVVLTDFGRDALEHFMNLHPEAESEGVKARLELDNDVQLLGELHKVENGFRRYRRAMGLSKDEADVTLKHFDIFQKAVIDQARRKMEVVMKGIKNRPG